MTTKTQILTLLVVVTMSSGCAKLRQLTGRDYASTKDPFLDRSAVAKVDAVEQNSSRGRAPATNGTSGVVQVADLNAPLSANNKVRTATQSETKPQFGGIRVSGMENTIATDSQPNAFSDLIRTASQTKTANAPQSTSEVTDMAGFTEFVKKEAEASGMTETAKDLDGMAEWFTAKNEKWQQQAAEIEEVASPLINAVSQTRTVQPPPDMPTLPELGFGEQLTTRAKEMATPLIQSRGEAAAAAAASWIVPTVTTGASPVPTRGESEVTPISHIQAAPSANMPPIPQPEQSISQNPFGAEHIPPPVFDQQPTDEKWNPFEAFDREPSRAVRVNAEASPFGDALTKPKPVGSSSSQTDSGFDFDSGWRSSNVK